MTIRDLYIRNIGEIPANYEVHHIIPRHAGGDDTFDNLIAVSKTMHQELHLDRYKHTEDFRDLCAYYMIGYNFSEAHKISSSAGGKIGGTKVKEKGVGIFRDEDDRKLWASEGGKVGGKKQYDLKLGIHGATKEQMTEWGRMGSSAAGNFTNKTFQSEMGKRGGVKNKGFKWITDGKEDIKYTIKMQDVLPIELFLINNPTFRLGRLYRTKKSSDMTTSSQELNCSGGACEL